MPNSVVNFGKFQYITQIIGDDRYDSENRSRQRVEMVRIKTDRRQQFAARVPSNK